MKLGKVENLKHQTKAKSSKHGGARPGAGRKKKPVAPAIPLRMSASDASAQDLAKSYLGLAIDTLNTIASKGASESARVSAAKIIIETANGKPKAAQGAAPNQRCEDDQDRPSWDDLLGLPGDAN
jgi:hypothetical protein